MRFLAVIFVLASAPAAFAQEPAQQVMPEAITNTYRCMEIADDAQRLACYDQAVGRLRQAESQGQIVALDRERVNTLRRESFGFSLPNLARLMPGGENEPIERIETTVERVIEHQLGRRSFVLSNGQTWTQVETRSARNVRPGDTVTIRQASLGSFMLSPESGPDHRVRREN